MRAPPIASLVKFYSDLMFAVTLVCRADLILYRKVTPPGVVGVPMPEVTRAPLEDLSPREQGAQRRDDAKDTLASIDEFLPKRTLSDADLTKVKQIREQVAKFTGAGKWAKASDAGTEALLKLGVSLDRC